MDQRAVGSVKGRPAGRLRAVVRLALGIHPTACIVVEGGAAETALRESLGGWSPPSRGWKIAVKLGSGPQQE